MSARILAADGPRAVLLRFEAGAGAPESAILPGMVTPIWSTGGGRALLWGASDKEIRSLLADSQFIGVGGPYAAKSTGDVIDRLAHDRERGYVAAVEEFEHGITEIAHPVLVRGKPIAAVSAACHCKDSESHWILAGDIVSVAQQLGEHASAFPSAAD